MSNGTAPAAARMVDAPAEGLAESVLPARGIGATGSPPLLVAVDGSRASTAALRMAIAIAQRDHEATELITVDEALPRVGGGLCVGAQTLRGAGVGEESRLGRVRRQLYATLGEAWNLHVEYGRTAHTIAAAARQCGARLIVMGLRPHRGPKLLQGVETAERVLCHASVPVLAVEGSARALPRTAVAAVDFSRTGMRAALAALSVLQRPGTLYLVHVRPRLELPIEDAEGWAAAYEAGVSSALARICEAWSGGGVTVTARVLSGPAADQLLQFAGSVSADLIACGTHGHNIVERMMIGSTARELLHAGVVSLLVAPPDENATGGHDATAR